LMFQRGARPHASSRPRVPAERWPMVEPHSITNRLRIKALRKQPTSVLTKPPHLPNLRTHQTTAPTKPPHPPNLRTHQTSAPTKPPHPPNHRTYQTKRRPSSELYSTTHVVISTAQSYNPAHRSSNRRNHAASRRYIHQVFPPFAAAPYYRMREMSYRRSTKVRRRAFSEEPRSDNKRGAEVYPAVRGLFGRRSPRRFGSQIPRP
jgi:hypothetical protein